MSPDGPDRRLNHHKEGRSSYTDITCTQGLIPVGRRFTRKGNQKKLGILVAAFFGFILLTSTVMIAIPGLQMGGNQAQEVTITGTPADNYPDMQRPQFCGIGQPKSTAYVTEYRVPTVCSQPVAVHIMPDGTVWFAQSNTGNVAKLDPNTGLIQEFENEQWADDKPSMIWGMDYGNGYLWFTDEINDAIWSFDISTGTYQQFPIPESTGSTYPQLLKVQGTDIILNDLIGNRLIILDASDVESGLSYYAVPSDTPNAVTAGFATDQAGDIWYTTWIDGAGGLLVKVDPSLIKLEEAEEPVIVTLPQGLRAPNGITVDHRGNVWLADTGTSNIFVYNPTLDEFTHYFTSTPDILTYGNVTGIVQNPMSRPYWIHTAGDGRLVFNEQTANRIGVMDPNSEKLVEYTIPSRNPFWADCGRDPICGISQSLGIDVSGTNVWFTEWVENNVGSVDITKSLPFDIALGSNRITLTAGESESIAYVVEPLTDRPLAIETHSASSDAFLYVQPHLPPQLTILEDAHFVTVDVVTTEDAQPGTYKILLGAEGDAVSVSRFVTVDILPGS